MQRGNTVTAEVERASAAAVSCGNSSAACDAHVARDKIASLASDRTALVLGEPLSETIGNAHGDQRGEASTCSSTYDSHEKGGAGKAYILSKEEAALAIHRGSVQRQGR